MQTSGSLSSSLVAQNDLLQTIASLRSQLAQTQLQLERANEGPFQQQRATWRPASPPAGSRAEAGPVVPRPRVSSRESSRPGPRAPSSSNGNHGYGHNGAHFDYAGTVSNYFDASPTTYTLKRDKSYDDLKSVMSWPSPSSSSSRTNGRKNSLSQQDSPGTSNGTGNVVGFGLHSSSRRRRSSSTAAGSDSGRNSASTRIPMPVMPRGSVGVAAALAGGTSPKSPLSQNYSNEGDLEDDNEADATFDGPPPRLLEPDRLLSSANGSLRYKNAHHDFDTSNQDSPASLPPHPSASRRPFSPPMRPGKSSESESSATWTEDERTSRPSAARASSSPFFGGSAGFTERHGPYKAVDALCKALMS